MEHLILKKMAALGLNNRELARRTGYTEAHTSCISRGKSQPSLDSLFAICGALELEPSKVIQEFIPEKKEKTTIGATKYEFRNGVKHYKE